MQPIYIPRFCLEVGIYTFYKHCIESARLFFFFLLSRALTFQFMFISHAHRRHALNFSRALSNSHSSRKRRRHAHRLLLDSILFSFLPVALAFEFCGAGGREGATAVEGHRRFLPPPPSPRFFSDKSRPVATRSLQLFDE